MSTIEVKYLTKNNEYKLLEIADSTSSIDDGVVGIQSEKEEWKKELVSISGVPEFKTEICNKRVKIPFNGHVNVPYPCLYTRTSKHWMELRVKYPPDAKDKVIKCAEEAAILAAGVVVAGILAPPSIAILIPSAHAAFALKFSECLEEEIRKNVDVEITHESKSGEWNRV